MEERLYSLYDFNFIILYLYWAYFQKPHFYDFILRLLFLLIIISNVDFQIYPPNFFLLAEEDGAAPQPARVGTGTWLCPGGGRAVGGGPGRQQGHTTRHSGRTLALSTL